MAVVSVIRHSLDLALLLVDSASGGPARGALRLIRDGEELPFRSREAGRAMLQNIGREDFLLELRMDGYETATVPVRYEPLPGAAENGAPGAAAKASARPRGEETGRLVSRRLPELEVHLIPQERYGQDYITFAGTMKGLRAFDAVRLGSSVQIAQELDERKRLLTVQDPYRAGLDGSYYGVVAADGTAFEAITVLKQTAENVYKLEANPQGSISGMSILRRALGQMADGRYLLRLPFDSGSAKWVVRAGTDAEERFQLVDFADFRGTPPLGPLGFDAPQSAQKRKTEEWAAGMKGG